MDASVSGSVTLASVVGVSVGMTGAVSVVGALFGDRTRISIIRTMIKARGIKSLTRSALLKPER